MRIVFSVEENGVLYMTVGFARTEEGLGYLDAAVRFCSFCGTELQTDDEIRRAAGTPTQ